MTSHYGLLQPLLTDFYQLTMSYAYWKAGKAHEPAVFEVFFRRNPFNGEFTIFAGLTDCIDYLSSFKFTPKDVAYLKEAMPACTDPAFFDYLLTLTAADFDLWSVEEGTAVFPREPIMRVEGPIILCQLVETAILNLVNFASLIATNAARFRLTAGSDKLLFEFGLRRAQGPDGGLTASRYAYLGGYDGTSNVLAGKMFGIPVVGTHAHSFISAFQGNSDVNHQKSVELPGDDPNDDKFRDLTSIPMQLDKFLERCWHWSRRLSHLLNYSPDQVHHGELTAFANYAFAFPDAFVGLIDTYDVLRSGVPNFCAVGLALHEHGHRPVGIRIDSGDLAFLSLMVRDDFKKIAQHYNIPWFEDLRILVSNDLNEDTLHSLNLQLPPRGHSIDAFCVGTHLVTCQKQPALGCVYKLVEIAGTPTMKLSAQVEKVTLPGKKTVYRLYSKTGEALVDLLQRSDEPAPKVNERILCRHPSEASKRVFVVPARIEETLKLFWKRGQLSTPLSTLEQSRERVQKEIKSLRPDYTRLLNPTPYKVSLSEQLYNFTYDLWLRMTPISELS
ncbi:Nicotinate phosphoribosyltransferase [Clonorchis sinensis]|uniref:Nicotinate phosphoribosyltransferase n=1 Tax=Clonorchis sinensis TaxID=79923 RepID=A0A8T1M006_CLOSI|nr:Nicotinate phosphoribosyltransferase [Clonorchis sinensis]